MGDTSGAHWISPVGSKREMERPFPDKERESLRKGPLPSLSLLSLEHSLKGPLFDLHKSGQVTYGSLESSSL